MGIDLLQEENIKNYVEPNKFQTPNVDVTRQSDKVPIPTINFTRDEILSAVRQGNFDGQNVTAPMFQFPADGTTYLTPIPFLPKSLYILNASNVPFTIFFDDGSQIIAWPGSPYVIIPPSTQWLKTSSNTPGTGSIVLVPFDRIASIQYGGVNQPNAAVASQEHIFNLSVGNTAIQCVPARPNRVSVTIVNEGTSAIRAGNTADGISATVGEYIAAGGGSANFIGDERIDVCGTVAGPTAVSGVDAWN